jgi:hypothetical protein
MKKLLLTSVVAFATCISSFAQGNVLFGASSKAIWDDFSTGTPHLAADLYVALVFSATTPTIEGITGTGLATAGNGSVYTATNSTSATTSFTAATAWNDILKGNGFLVDGPTALTALQGSTSANGSVTYNASTAFSADNVIAGTTYYGYLIAWSTAYSTPTLAAAADAAVGWSAYFTYTPTSGINIPVNINTLTIPFGVAPVTVPEPCTMALLGLGGLSLLVIRRRK